MPAWIPLFALAVIATTAIVATRIGARAGMRARRPKAARPVDLVKAFSASVGETPASASSSRAGGDPENLDELLRGFLTEHAKASREVSDELVGLVRLAIGAKEPAGGGSSELLSGSVAAKFGIYVPFPRTNPTGPPPESAEEAVSAQVPRTNPTGPPPESAEEAVSAQAVGSTGHE